ncbi:abortive infection family protein [Pseudonocardia parietis]|uniref:abortive infection family protein n=1 Tax=Pseudonocardia parietis TaxID=570936 RepID=UPI0027DE3D68|nr:abortive infection family protein [Pseudonocardia parietis]
MFSGLSSLVIEGGRAVAGQRARRVRQPGRRLGELRNRGYATGHGAGRARVGLHSRHAQLAVNAAVTWCQLILNTLADTNAP